MKTKLICSALLGATICGSAFAISVDDRQAFCEQHPDKYVWVEKNQACVPVNTCDFTVKADQPQIYDAYCKEYDDFMYDTRFDVPTAKSYAENVLKEYFRINGNLSVKEFNHIAFSKLENVCAKTSDGMYSCFPFEYDSINWARENAAIQCDVTGLFNAKEVYNNFIGMSFMCDEYTCFERDGLDASHLACEALFEIKKENLHYCEEVAKTASSLGNQNCTSEIEEGTAYSNLPMCRVVCRL